MEKKNFVQDAMQEVESLLKNAFAAAMQQGKLPENELPAFTVEIPAETTHGDFASNAAMVSARTFRMAPVKIANILAECIDCASLYQFLCQRRLVCQHRLRRAGSGRGIWPLGYRQGRKGDG